VDDRKKRPPESEEELRHEETRAEDEQPKRDTPPAFFSFEGQLTPHEFSPTPKPEKTELGDVVEGDLLAPEERDEESTQTEHQAGPVREDDPAASTSASQSEAAGPAISSEHEEAGDAPASSKEEEEEESGLFAEDDEVTETAAPDVSTQTDVFGMPETDETQGELVLPVRVGEVLGDEDVDADEHTQTEVESFSAGEEADDSTQTEAEGFSVGEETASPVPDTEAHTHTELGGFDEPGPGAPAADDESRTRTELGGEQPDDESRTHTELGGFEAEDERAPAQEESRTQTELGAEPFAQPAPDTRTVDPPGDVTRTEHGVADPADDTATFDLEPELKVPQPPPSFEETIDVPAELTHTELPFFPDAEQVEAGDLPAPQPAPERRSRRRRAPRPKPKRVRVALGGLVARAKEAVGGWIGQRKDAYEEWAQRKQAAREENRLSQTAQWWRRTATEIAVLYAIVVPIEMAVNGGRVGAFGVHPHPYWLIVLPIAAARGVVAGLLAAAVASLLYAIGAITGVNNPALLFTYGTMTEPILFFAVGYLVGELHDELALRNRKLQKRIDDLTERVTRLRQERDVLADANRELERRIVDDSTQFGNLILAAKRIEQAGRTEVFDLALEMVDEHCGAVASVLLLLEDGSLDLLCQLGWPDDEVSDRLEAARASRFVERAIAEGVVANGFNPNEAPPEKGPLVVAPLFDAGGVVKALLCLDDVPPARLNESTITIFLGIADWTSAALARIARGAEAPAPHRTLPATPEAEIYVGTASDLGERLRLEVERCTRYGVPTSFLAIQGTEWADPTPEGVAELDRYILTHFTTGLRPSDGIYRFGYPGCYLLILAGTTVQGAQVVRTRLLRRVEYSPNSRIGAIEIFATGPDADAPDLLTLVERVAACFRRFSSLPLDGSCPVQVPDGPRPGRIDEFVRRLRVETSLAVRNGFDLHVVGITAETVHDNDPGLLARHVQEAGRTLRPTDGVYAIGPRHCAVILPCTAGEEAASVGHRLVTAVRERDPNAPYGQLETNVLGLGENHPDAGSLLSALAQKGEEA